MESTHQHEHEQTPARARGNRPVEDWNSDEFVEYWIASQKDREPERHRQFVTIRAFIPKAPGDEFSYINLGAGPGNLDEVLLEQFPNASATLVDGSLAMLNAARKRLEHFEDRVEYVQANLASKDWVGAVSGPFDVAVSSIALHNLDDGRLSMDDRRRIPPLYREICELLGHGGIFLNLDYLKSSSPELQPLGRWASRDPEAGFGRYGGGEHMPGTLADQLSWLRDAGFAAVDAPWKQGNVALLCGLRDHLHLPDTGSTDNRGHEGEHTHAH